MEPTPLVEPSVDTRPPSSRLQRLRRSPLVRPFALLGHPAARAALLAAAITLAFVAQDYLDARDHLHAAITLYLVALALAALAFAGWRRAPADAPLPRWLEVSALVTILALALALRLFRWDTIPPGVVFDEAANALEAEEIARTNDHYLWSDALSGRPTLYLEIVAGFFKAFGTEVFVLRFVSILIGVATVFATYLFAREAFDARTGLLAAFLMAVMRWANHYSRLALEAVLAPFFILICAYFLLRGLRTGKPWWYAASGVALGLGLYTYISFRLVPMVIGAFLVLVLAQGRWTFLRRHWLGLATFAVVTLAVVFPLARFARENEERFSGRFDEVSVFSQVDEADSWDPLLGNIARHLEMFNYKGPWFAGMNVPNIPMLSPPLAVLFALSLSLVVVRIGKPAYYLLPLWFAAGLTAGIVTVQEETPHATRTIIVLPLVAVLGALFLREALALGAGALGRLRFALALPCVAVLVLIGVIENDTYFNRYADNPNACNAFSCDATILARYLDDTSADHQTYMAAAFYHFPTDSIVDFVAADSRGKHRQLDFSEDLPARFPEQDLLYILENTQSVYLPLLQHVYPGGTFEEHHWFDGRTVFLSYSVSREEAAGALGLTARYYPNDAWQGAPAVERREPTVGADDAPATLPVPYSVEWSGTLYVSSFQLHRFIVPGPGEAGVLIDGRQWPDEGDLLEKGLHALTVRYRPLERETPAFLWERGGAPEAVPAASLFAFETDLHGLRASYWENTTFEGAPAFVQIDPVIFANNVIPGPHSIEWSGWLRVDTPGEYTLATVSDDGSFLFVADELVVDNGGVHGPERKEATRFLDSGYHPIRMRYYEEFGGRYTELRWTPPGGDDATVPQDALYFRLPPDGEPEPPGR